MFAAATNRSVRWKAAMPIEWHDCAWRPPIKLRRSGEIHCRPAAKPLPSTALLSHAVRRNNLAKPMKKIGNRKTPAANARAFTLVELLVVIAIIGILAAMLMPVLAAAKKRALVVKSKTEIEGIVNAVNAYDTDYGRFPMTKDQQKYAGVNDYTTGYVQNPQANITWPPIAAWDGTHVFSIDNNSNTIAMLMDLTSFGNGVLTANTNHVENPKQVKYLAAKEVTDSTQPGVGPDGVYRDPWGNPYIITMNSSYNEQGCRDIFYSQQKVSQQSGQTGYEGLFNPNASNPNSDNFLYHGKVMVWSAGPDKQVKNIPANQGVNKDNITSW